MALAQSSGCVRGVSNPNLFPWSNSLAPRDRVCLLHFSTSGPHQRLLSLFEALLYSHLKSTNGSESGHIDIDCWLSWLSFFGDGLISTDFIRVG